MAEKKYLGRDCELSTTGMNAKNRPIDPWRVTRDVLARVERAVNNLGAKDWSHDTRNGYSGTSFCGSAQSIDCLRHWTSGGQCLYADMSHAEVCTPSTLHPRTFAAQSIATLLIAEEARQLAQRSAESGTRYHLSASNADLSDSGISFESHISVSVSTALWEYLFVDPRRPSVLGFVASVMAAAIPFFGAGYLLPTNNRGTIFSLSARAHHLSKIHTLTTTEKWKRGLLNSRRESHGTPLERLHLIGFDYAILASALLASLLQCSLAAAEEGFCGLNLYDPVDAMRRWSWNLDLTTGKMSATAILTDGRQLTLPDYIRELATTLLEMRENRLIVEAVAPSPLLEQAQAWANLAREAHDNCVRGEEAEQMLQRRRNTSGQ